MEILQTIVEKYTWLIALLALFGIEVSPIKFNPITLIGRLLGKFLGIDKILERIVKLETDVRDNELDRIKAEILQFSGSLRHGLNRNETDYLHIESIYIKYVNFCTVLNTKSSRLTLSKLDGKCAKEQYNGA